MFGIIYGIFHNNKLIYIGSTTKTINERFSKHIFSMKSNQSKTNVLYNYMNKYQLSEFNIKIIVEKEYQNKSIMLKNEGEIQLLLKPLCNQRIAKGRSKEYYEKNTREYKQQREYKKLVIQQLNDIFGEYLIYYIETQYGVQEKIDKYKRKV